MLVEARGVARALVVPGASRHDGSPLEALLDSIVIEDLLYSSVLRIYVLTRGYTGEGALETVV